MAGFSLPWASFMISTPISIYFKKASLLRHRREKYGTIYYFGHRYFQLREDIKMFQETQPLKYSNRFTSIIDSSVIRTFHQHRTLLWLGRFRSQPLGTFINSGILPQPLLILTTACPTHRSKPKLWLTTSFYKRLHFKLFCGKEVGSIIYCFAMYSWKTINAPLVKSFVSLNRRVSVDIDGNETVI